MIRRVTEYVIVCDGDRLFDDGGCKGDYGGTAFGSSSMADCAASATNFQWKQISKRLWLCPQCAKAYDAATQAKGERQQ